MKVTLGGKLVVIPHVPKLSGISTGGTSRLNALKSLSALSHVSARNKG